MSMLQIGRLHLGPPWQWYEAIGDPVTNLGGAAIPAPRQALRHQISIATVSADGPLDTVATRKANRRQLRSMFNNSDLKLQGFFYVIYSDDPEQNGWYVPDFGQLQDIDAAVGLATGIWKLDLVAWIKQGHLRTNREARNIWMKDMRTGIPWRDTLKLIYSTEYNLLPALNLTQTPPGATAVTRVTNGQRFALAAMPVGRDGGICQQCSGAVDLDCLGFDRAESSMGLGDVRVLDRRGNITGPFYLANILQDNPVSYWRLDETSGTVASDSMGNNNLNYTAGFTLNQTGALGGGSDNDASVSLNGTTGYINSPSAAPDSLSPTSAFTLEAWVNPTSQPAVGAIIGNQNSSTTGYILRYDVGKFQLWADSVTVTSPLTYAAGVWYHVVASWDGSTIRLYVDGTLVASTAQAVITFNGTNHFQIGSYNSGSAGNGSNFFPGSIDEVAVYNYALTTSQIANHYAAGATYDGGNQWEEAYGPDYPWSWTTGGIADAPVLDNGLCRVRYDSTNIGFRVDIWTPTGAANGTPGWVEQGKLRITRVGDSTNVTNTWISAGIHTDGGYTYDRAVISTVLALSSDNFSRERAYITMQRGIVGATFECYPAPKQAGTVADVYFNWSPALNSNVADLNNSLLKIDSLGGSGSTTVAAGSNGVNVVSFTGSGSLSVASLAAANAAGGTVSVQTASGTALITYAGTDGANALLGCKLAGGTAGGLLATGGAVVFASVSGWAAGGAYSTQSAGPAPGIYVATAGTGAGAGNSGLFGAVATFGNGNFSASENWIALLRCPTTYNVIAPYQTNFAVLQAANAWCQYLGADTVVYGVSSDAYRIRSQNGAGYLSLDLGFATTVADQVMEAESMTLGANYSSVVDASASGGNTAQTTQTTDTSTISRATWPNAFLATYRVFARIKATNTCKLFAATGASTGAQVTVAGASTPVYTWVDLGEVVANNTTLNIHGWLLGAGTLDIDRIEAVLVQDRARAGFIFTGARDNAQTELFDSRTLGAVVAR